MQLINAGFLNDHTLPELADRLGIGERYLRKLFESQVGVSPAAVAHTQRLHFAQKLLLETALPLTEIAFASGFGSVRRFNSALREKFGCSPRELRQRRGSRRGPADALRIELSYRPPYDWAGVMNFFSRHAVDGMETVSADSYQRSIEVAGQAGLITVRPAVGRDALLLDAQLPDARQIVPVVARVRRMFDLDASPASIAGALSAEPVLGGLLARFPGIRSPVHWSLFEASVRAIVGQQVSTAAARSVLSSLVRRCGRHGGSPSHGRYRFPTPGELLALADGELPMPRSRKRSLRALCEYMQAAPEPDSTDELAALPGVGPWTCAMITMRGLGDPDAFPATDLGLARAANSLGCATGSRGQPEHESWRPWRAYAANLLWRSLS
jgi:AraC family transcriptional regulator of adaptative response / DNA-3-methyladenine glycosylase II